MVTRLTVLSDPNNWINQYLPVWLPSLKKYAGDIYWIHDANDLPEGDVAFFLGCEQIVGSDLLSRNRNNLVVHASDLPKGKGWSPLTWQILEGKNEIPVVLFEAAEKVDAGPIYCRRTMRFGGLELIGELRNALARTTFELCEEFLEGYPGIVHFGVRQQGEETFYPRRTPADSRINPDRSLREQFQLLRVADNERYPCYFELDGETFVIKVEKRR
ncbi:methionyl-tRNA formyltransferase [Cohnella xylanilytica]|uniref:Methionyl-tRNA formyltransferase n=1 Tax=Cohnella xylanilytica TaxID=557555 RepID=A0A841TX71_9BACL|nr:formyltransferase family protein [Cohnella xylanilytica]MBB6692856.1 methionyl-tRNA formyltransferase [Cohnella xylanilytica]